MNELDGMVLNKGGFAYRDLVGQDRWGAFTPIWTNLSVTGNLTTNARLRIIGKICYFQVKLQGSTNLSMTAGTTYMELPVHARGFTGLSTMTNFTDNKAVGVCHVDVVDDRLYPPSQTPSGDEFSLAGWYEI